MNMTKGKHPTEKKGGMRAHLPASPGNNPTTSKTPGTEFSGKNCCKGSGSSRHKEASNGHDNGGSH